MRVICCLLLVVGFTNLGRGQDVKVVKRFDIALDEGGFPQKTAKEALASVIAAIEKGKIDYLLAHLAEPAYIDERVQRLEGGFPAVTKEAKAKLADDPGTLKLLKKFARDGEWGEGEDVITVTLKDHKDRVVVLKKVKDRWFMENQQKPKAEK